MNADHDVQDNNKNGDNVGASDDNEEDDEDLQEEDLDVFLVNLEARLRADFTSFDLSCSSSSSSSLLSTPARFLRLMHKVFHRAAKSIKLRALISVMGLDNDDNIANNNNGDGGGMNRSSSSSYINSSTTGTNSSSNDHEDDGGRKTDAIVWKLLSHAMKKDDEIWVRVIAEIVRNIMFQRRKTKLTNNNNNNSKKNANVDGDASDDDRLELELETESKLHKVSETILRGVEEACLRAKKRYDSTVKQGMQQQEDNQELMEQQENQKLFATLLIGADIDPFYVPLRYHLLPSKVLRAILPEFESSSTAILYQQHFTPNMKSEILNMDDSYVEEERTVMVAPTVASAQHTQPLNNNRGGMMMGRGNGVTAGGLTQVPDRINSVIDRGRFANSGQARGTAGATSSLFRPSVNTSIAVGMGGASTGRGRMGGVGRGLGGRMAAGVGRGAGGGSGGRSLASLVAGGMGRGGLAGRGAVVNATSGTKMKMIDVAEIEGLAHAAQVKNDVSGLSAVEMRKLERKRKLLEDAAASGL